ncbi:hypothetical protein NRS6120_06190 [Bacillus subtilis]|nr:hypothetical protein NRS6120_02783 [Bacillus subtilis]CAI6247798.1 hypothetical protein NRS6120_06190 [Bacillus subtilis]
MGALFLHLKPDEYLKKLYKTKKLVEKTSFSLQAEHALRCVFFAFFYLFQGCNVNQISS